MASFVARSQASSGARRGFIQRYNLIKKVREGGGGRPDDGEITLKCILDKRDFEFYIVW